jgi:hypothetical protein
LVDNEWLRKVVKIFNFFKRKYTYSTFLNVFLSVVLVALQIMANRCFQYSGKYLYLLCSCRYTGDLTLESCIRDKLSAKENYNLQIFIRFLKVSLRSFLFIILNPLFRCRFESVCNFGLDFSDHLISLIIYLST